MLYQDKLDLFEAGFNELEQQMADPALIADGEAYRKAAKRRSDLEEVVSIYRQFKVADRNLSEARVMRLDADPELREMADAEIAQLEPEVVSLEEQLKVLLLPKDPNDDKNVVIEIRAGTGGDEATLFAAEIFRVNTSLHVGKGDLRVELPREKRLRPAFEFFCIGLHGDDVLGLEDAAEFVGHPGEFIRKLDF